MIHDADETLIRMLQAELIKLPGCPIRDRAQITFDPPTVAEANQDGEARLNLYLFDVRENLQERSEGFVRRPSRADDETLGTSRVPAQMDLTYLISTHAGDDPRTEHRLLGEVLAVLLRRKTVAPEYLAGALGGIPCPVRLAVAQPEHVAAADPKSLWQALGGQLRPALFLVVTAPLDPHETVWTRRIREAVLGTGPISSGGGRTDAAERQETRLSVAGVVADQETEQPLAEVAVWVDGEISSVQTDERGLFLLTDLSAGRHTLRFAKQTYQAQEAEVTISLSPKAAAEPLVVALRPLSPAGLAAETAGRREAARNAPGLAEESRTSRVTLSGCLRLKSGAPAAGVVVRTGEQRTVTDGAGVYCFFDLPPGDHAVYAALPGEDESLVPAA